MRLGDCLLQADILFLRNIASSYQFDCSLNSKNELISTLLQNLRNEDFVSKAISSIQDLSIRDVCIQLALYPRNELTQEEIHAITSRSKAKYPSKKPLMDLFLKQGFLYPIGARKSISKYILPEEISLLLKKVVTRLMKTQVELSPVEPIIWREEKGALLRDIELFLKQCDLTQMKLTVEGVIFKKQLESLMQLFEIQETPLSGKGWRFGYGKSFHMYPDRFAFLYDYCCKRELILEDFEKGVIEVTGLGKKWHEKPEENRQADLLQVYGLLYRRPIARLPFLVASITAMCEGQWVTLESVRQQIKSYLTPYYFDDEDTLFEKRILAMLIHLGVLQQGSLSSGVHVLRCSLELKQVEPMETTQSSEPEILQTNPQLFIQPNFELLVPKENVSYFSQEIEDFAELKKADVMRVYRMTKATIVRAIRTGWTEETLLNYLDQASGGMVPINVKRMIANWMGEFGKVTLYKTAVMECRTPDVAQEILQLPSIKKEIWGRIGDRHLLIREEAFEHLTQTLEELGYLPDVWS